MLGLVEKLYAWLSRDERFARIGWGLLLAAGLGFGAYVMGGHMFVPKLQPPSARYEAVQRCYFHRVTGLPCPFCGLTRGCGAFLRGRWSRSADLHPAAGLLCVAVGLLVVEAGRRVASKHPARRAGAGVAAVLGALGAFGLGVAATWAVRLAG